MGENSLEATEDAMIVIQQSMEAIKKTAEKFNQLEGNSREVLVAMAQLTNKVTSLEAKIESGSGLQRTRKTNSKINVPLYIKVSNITTVHDYD